MREKKPLKCIRNGCTNQANSEWICEPHAKERAKLAEDFYAGKPTAQQQRVIILRSMRNLHKPGR